jgi:preprotein translocase subunit SecA
MSEKDETYGEEFMKNAEKTLYLRILDQMWKDHLLHLDHLRQGISLRAYAQKDPLNEYKREAFLLFQDMLERVEESLISYLGHIHIPQHSSFEETPGPMMETDRPRVSEIPRNAECPCGSGLRYKHCHGKIGS